MKTILLFTVLFSSIASATASDFDRNYYTIKSAVLTEVAEETKEFSDDSFIDDSCIMDQDGMEDVDIGQIINYGKMLWKFIKDNKPVVSVKTNSANALPKGIKSSYELSGWKGIVNKTYALKYENLFGMTVIDLKFRVSFTYGGSYKGKGMYVTNATIIPALVSVAWGYTFNADVAVNNVLNVGTERAPVGAIDISIRYAIDTVMKHNEEMYTFFVRGDGKLIDMN